MSRKINDNRITCLACCPNSGLQLDIIGLIGCHYPVAICICVGDRQARQIAQINAESGCRTCPTECHSNFVVSSAARNGAGATRQIGSENRTTVIVISTQFGEIEAKFSNFAGELPGQKFERIQARGQLREIR